MFKTILLGVAMTGVVHVFYARVKKYALESYCAVDIR
jgi:hypothetical protein